MWVTLLTPKTVALFYDENVKIVASTGENAQWEEHVPRLETRNAFSGSKDNRFFSGRVSCLAPCQ